MAVPMSGFSLITVCNEIYGSNPTHVGKSLVGCFADATGTFKTSNRNSLLDFAGYVHFTPGPNLFPKYWGWSHIENPFVWRESDHDVMMMVAPDRMHLYGKGTAYLETVNSFTGVYEFSYDYTVRDYSTGSESTYIDPAVCQLWSQFGSTRLTPDNDHGAGHVTGSVRASGQKLRVYVHSILFSPNIMIRLYNPVFRKIGN